MLSDDTLKPRQLCTIHVDLKVPKRHSRGDEPGTVSRLENRTTAGKSNLVRGPANQCQRLGETSGLICPLGRPCCPQDTPALHSGCLFGSPELVLIGVKIAVGLYPSLGLSGEMALPPC